MVSVGTGLDPVNEIVVQTKRDWYTDSEIKSLGGMGIFTWLDVKPEVVPDEVWAKFCHCSGAGKELRGWGYDETGNWWYHIGCGKPRPHWAAIFVCEYCEDYYASPRLPDRTRVCPACLAVQ